jgi:hypothetical protein
VLRTDSENIINPQNVADRLNSVFIDCADLPVKNKPYRNGQTSQMKIKNNSNAMFLYPLTEEKLNKLVCKFKGKASTGFDQVTEFLVKKFSVFSKPLIFIFNVSINQGIFPELTKMQK